MPDPVHVERWAQLDPWLAQLGLAGAVPVRRIGDADGAYSPAGRWIVERADGTRSFVKAMRSRPLAAGGSLEREHLVVATIESSFVVRVDAWRSGSEAEGSPSVLVVEDLGECTWGTPLDEARVQGLRTALDELATVTPPLQLPADPGRWDGLGWDDLLDRPEPLLARGIVDVDWLEAHGPGLARAAADIDTTGEGLVHGDLWLQNWCSRRDASAMLIDWNGAHRGNPRLNHAWGEAGVRAAAGPAGIVLGAKERDHDAWAAWMCALALAFLADEGFDRRAHARLHRTQVREARATLDWVCETFDLPLPRGDAEALDVGPWEP